jgi:hypothetical protein
MEQFGECIVSREKGRTAKLIDLRVDTTEHDKLLDAMVDSEDQCLSDGTLRSSTLMMRGAIFQVALPPRLCRCRCPHRLSGGIEERCDRALYPAELSDEARMYLSLNHFGECEFACRWARRAPAWSSAVQEAHRRARRSRC